MRRPLIAGESAIYFGWRDSDYAPVAIKVPHPGSEQAAEGEARALAELRHPNIVPLIAYEKTSEGRPALVLPMLLPATYFMPMGLAETKKTLAGVLNALEYIHARGHVFGDLRAENIVVDDERTPILVDFGNFYRDDFWTVPEIMAPEFITGAANSPLSDIYAAGLLALELVGRPFIRPGGAPSKAIAAHLHQHPQPTGFDELDAVIARACSKDPAKRYQSAVEMREAIGHAA